MVGKLPVTFEDAERGLHHVEIVVRGTELVVENVDRPFKLFALGEKGGQDVGKGFFGRIVGIVHEWDGRRDLEERTGTFGEFAP